MIDEIIFGIPVLDQILDEIYKLDSSSHARKCTCKHTACQSSGHWCPSIKRVTFNGDTSVVWFDDGTRVIVKCSKDDKYDRKTALVYAIAKRLLGKVKANGEVEGNGFCTTLQKIVDNGFDQQLEEKQAAERKRHAKAEHEARQAAQKQAAFEKRVEKRAREMLLERAATARANELEDIERNAPKCPSKTCTCKNQPSKNAYVRPDKPFSQFSPEEKRAYWREHNARRRAK